MISDICQISWQIRPSKNLKKSVQMSRFSRYLKRAPPPSHSLPLKLPFFKFFSLETLFIGCLLPYYSPLLVSISCCTFLQLSFFVAMVIWTRFQCLEEKSVRPPQKSVWKSGLAFHQIFYQIFDQNLLVGWPFEQISEIWSDIWQISQLSAFRPCPSSAAWVLASKSRAFGPWRHIFSAYRLIYIIFWVVIVIDCSPICWGERDVSKSPKYLNNLSNKNICSFNGISLLSIMLSMIIQFFVIFRIV